VQALRKPRREKIALRIIEWSTPEEREKPLKERIVLARERLAKARGGNSRSRVHGTQEASP